MFHNERPAPIKVPFLSFGTKIILVIMFAGLATTAYRFIAGIGPVTNLNNGYGWGLWIAIDVACGVALAAGGFTTAALADIFHKEKYHVITRPALLTAMLGYTFVAIGVMTDLGRWYNIWHPIVPSMWQGNSALFEVGLCVMSYLTVLYIEFLPIVVERFKDQVKMPGVLSHLNGLINGFLHIADRTLCRVTSLFIIAGVVLSCMHQSSLGTLLVLAPTKMHPLWYTSILPLLFLISAIAVGFPMVIFESILASRSFKIKPETKVLSSIAKYTPILLGIYLAIKCIDLTIRNAWGYLATPSMESFLFLTELAIGVIIPMIILLRKKLRAKIGWLFTAASLVIAGIVMNRIDVFLVAYKPLYPEMYSYFPSAGEFLVTAGFIAALVILYRAFVMIFPVITQSEEDIQKQLEREKMNRMQILK